jgi:hypothetical protein
MGISLFVFYFLFLTQLILSKKFWKEVERIGFKSALRSNQFVAYSFFHGMLYQY